MANKSKLWKKVILFLCLYDMSPEIATLRNLLTVRHDIIVAICFAAKALFYFLRHDGETIGVGKNQVNFTRTQQ